MIRLLWMMMGGLAFAVGFIGLFLPLLPTVPFMLVAAFCFARSSERLHAWLMAHPTFGPQIRDWNERGAISRRAKQLSALSMAAAVGLSLAMHLPAHVIAMQLICMAGASLFIWTRPSG